MNKSENSISDYWEAIIAIGGAAITAIDITLQLMTFNFFKIDIGILLGFYLFLAFGISAIVKAVRKTRKKQKIDERKEIKSEAKNGSQSLAVGGDVYGNINQIIQYGERMKVGKAELQTMMSDYGVILVKISNKTGYTLYNCYTEIKAIKWDGDSYFSHYENKLIWINKHFHYNGYRAEIEHENYQYIGLGEKNSGFQGNAKFYSEGDFPIEIKHGNHVLKLQFGGETKSGQAITIVFNVEIENIQGKRLILGKEIKDIEYK